MRISQTSTRKLQCSSRWTSTNYRSWRAPSVSVACPPFYFLKMATSSTPFEVQVSFADTFLLAHDLPHFLTFLFTLLSTLQTRRVYERHFRVTHYDSVPITFLLLFHRLNSIKCLINCSYSESFLKARVVQRNRQRLAARLP